MRAWTAMLLLLLSLGAVAAPDYARERRWDEQITPSIVVGDPLYLQQTGGHRFLCIYTEAAAAKMGVVVVHGIGVNPDWGLIGTLRQRLPEHGYATLSIQMPVLAADANADAYAELFPDAIERLQLAVGYLRDKGYQRIAIVSHSLGSRMAYAYMKRNPPQVGAWAALGMSAQPSGQNAPLVYSGIEAPVLDLYGSEDQPQVLSGAAPRRTSLAGKASSRQLVLAGSNHFYAGHESEMVRAVVDFLDAIR